MFENNEGKTDVAAEPIIAWFGGVRPTAKALGVPVTTVQGWKKRNRIPANRVDAVKLIAEQRGKKNSGDLSSLFQPQAGDSQSNMPQSNMHGDSSSGAQGGAQSSSMSHSRGQGDSQAQDLVGEQASSLESATTVDKQASRETYAQSGSLAPSETFAQSETRAQSESRAMSEKQGTVGKTSVATHAQTDYQADRSAALEGNELDANASQKERFDSESTHDEENLTSQSGAKFGSAAAAGTRSKGNTETMSNEQSSGGVRKSGGFPLSTLLAAALTALVVSLLWWWLFGNRDAQSLRSASQANTEQSEKMSQEVADLKTQLAAIKSQLDGQSDAQSQALANFASSTDVADLGTRVDAVEGEVQSLAAAATTAATTGAMTGATTAAASSGAGQTNNLVSNSGATDTASASNSATSGATASGTNTDIEERLALFQDDIQSRVEGLEGKVSEMTTAGAGTSAEASEAANAMSAQSDAKFAEIGDTISGLSTTLETVQTDMGGLTEKVGALEGALETGLGGISEDFGGFQTSVDERFTSLGDQLKSTTVTATGAAVLATQAKGSTAKLATGLQSVTQATQSLNSRTSSLVQRQNNLGQELALTSNRLLGANKVVTSLEGTEPFENELGVLASVSEGDGVLSGIVKSLGPIAKTGVPSNDVLQEELEKAQATIDNDGEQPSGVDGVVRNLSGLVTFRRIGSIDADSPIAGVAESLQEGDLDAAVASVSDADDDTKQALGGWLDVAKQRQTADKAKSILEGWIKSNLNN